MGRGEASQPAVLSRKKEPIERRKENDETHSLRPTQRLFGRFDAGFAVDAHAADGLEALVGQHEDAAVVGFQVVDLLAEQQRP
jgi:hypothetical protein